MVLCEAVDLLYNSSNCITQLLSTVRIPQLDMQIEPMPTNTQNQNIEMIPKTIFVDNIESEKNSYPLRIIIDVEKDGEGFCAFSEKYHRFLGYGKTKDEAVDVFIELFKDKKYGEQLSNYYFHYQE